MAASKTPNNFPVVLRTLFKCQGICSWFFSECIFQVSAYHLCAVWNCWESAGAYLGWFVGEHDPDKSTLWTFLPSPTSTTTTLCQRIYTLHNCETQKINWCRLGKRCCCRLSITITKPKPMVRKSESLVWHLFWAKPTQCVGKCQRCTAKWKCGQTTIIVNKSSWCDEIK